MIENVARFLKKQYGFLMFLVVSLIVSLLLFAFSDLKYVTNDDYFISTISSGVYGWEYSQYLIYSNSVLGFFIKFLNNIVKANYYMIIQYILLVISASLFATITVSKTNNYKIGFALLILMWSVIYINLFTNITFTVTAGVASIIGLLGIITYYDKNRVLTITSLVLALFGYMYRYESFLLVAPFVGLYLVFLKKKSLFSIEASKKLIFYLLVLVACIICCVCVDAYTYRTEEWKEYKETDVVRSELHDYQNDYSLNNIDVDMNKNDLIMFYTWRNDNPKKFGYKNLSKLVDNSKIITLTIKDAIKGVYKFYFETFTLCQTILLVGLLLASVFLGLKIFMYTLFAYIGSSIIVSFFILLNRFPMRLANVIMFCIVCVSILFILEKRMNLSKSMITIPICILTMILLLVEFKSTLKTEQDYVFNIYDYTKNNKQHKYVLDTSAYSYLKTLNTISEDLMSNCVRIGGWIAPSPLSKQSCEKYNQTNALDVLGLEEDVYLITTIYKDISFIEKYISDNYNKNVKARLVENINELFVLYVFEEFQ